MAVRLCGPATRRRRIAGPNPMQPMTAFKRSSLRSAVCALLLLLPLAASADALLKPLPKPDTSKLAPEVAKQLDAARADFDRDRINRVGDALAQAFATMGAVYARAGLNEVAAIAFYDASQLSPKDSRWLYMRGVVAREQKLNADARAEFEAALALDQVYLPIRYRLADTLVDLGDADAGRKLLEAVAGQFKDQSALFAMIGRIDLKQKRYAEAVDNLNRALQIEPQASALYADLAEAYTGQGNAQLAQQAQAKAGTDQPSLADPLVAGIYTDRPALRGTPLEQARELLSQDRFDEARSKVALVLKADANNVPAIILAARIDALTGKAADARAEAAHALSLKPEDGTALLSQGMVLEFAGDEAQAYTFYQRAGRADPKLADAHLLLGNALMRRSQFAAAAEEYRQVVALTPGSIEPQGRLTAALVAAGRCSDAMAQINAELAKRAQDGNLMQIFVRVASTCAAVQSQERGMALDYAKALYQQRPNAGDSSALALALAAQGKFDEAQKYQAEAIYEVVRSGDTKLAQAFRATMRQFVAKQLPDRPWPPDHPYFHPLPLTPLAAPAPAPAPAK
jgi:tetratricopeptide (TPR) repeat protein